MVKIQLNWNRNLCREVQLTQNTSYSRLLQANERLTVLHSNN